jgi:type IV secretory pathway VirB2 component (pilin)
MRAGSVLRSPALVMGALGAWVGAWALVGYVDGLRAAGLNGKAPPNAAGFQRFVSSLTDNALWVIGTVAVLAIVVVGGLFFFGHTRAQDYAAKIAGGAMIVMLAPGLAA